MWLGNFRNGGLVKRARISECKEDKLTRLGKGRPHRWFSEASVVLILPPVV